jgi:hypothetical protein
MHVNTNSKWTEADDRRLLELKAAAKTNRAIGEALSRSAAAVEQRIYILRDRARLSQVK